MTTFEEIAKYNDIAVVGDYNGLMKKTSEEKKQHEERVTSNS